MEEKKKLGLFDLTSIGVGSIIGSGIFSMLGIGIYYTGRGIVLALVIAMFAVYLEYIRSSLVSATFEMKGGSYAQSALLLPPFFTGAGALIMVISNLGMSVQAIAMASYIAQLVPALANMQKLVAAVIMTLFFAISIRGSGLIAKVQNLMVVLMYVALGLFIVFGIIHFDPATTVEPFIPNGTVGLLTATAMMSFTCNGATNIVNLSDDAANPKKNVPNAILLSTVICTVVYALIGFAATSSLSSGEVAGQNLGFIAQRIMPSGVYYFFVVGGAIFALATSLLGGISAMRWPIVASAQDGWLPAVFTKTTKSGTPWTVMLMMYLIGIVPIIGGFSLESIVSLILVPAAISSIAGNLITWNMPKKYPKAWAENAWHMSEGMYHFFLILSTVAAIILTVFTLTTQTMGGILANLGMAAFLYIFGYLRYKSGKVHLAARDVYSE